MLNYMKWELKVFFSNHKNLIIFGLLFLTSLYYAFYMAPAYQPIESVDEKEIEVRYEERKEYLENSSLLTGSHPLSAFAHQIFPAWNEIDEERLAALADEDLHAYAKATNEWYLYAGEVIKWDPYDVLSYNPRYYTYGNRFADEDGHYNYLYSAERYGEYASAGYELNMNVFEERTALQSLKRLLDSSLPYILIIACLLLSNDIVMKDRRHASIVNGFPMTPFRRMMLKGLVALIGSFASIALLIPAFLIIGIRDGFGSLNLPAVIYDFAFFGNETFGNISMGMYLSKYFLMLLLWFSIIIGLVLLLSILFKNEYVNLVVGVLCFAEIIYYQRGWIPEEWLNYLPTSYIQIGNIISGYKNFTLYTDLLTIEKGAFVLTATMVLIIILIKLITMKKKMTL